LSISNLQREKSSDVPDELGVKTIKTRSINIVEVLPELHDARLYYYIIYRYRSCIYDQFVNFTKSIIGGFELFIRILFKNRVIKSSRKIHVRLDEWFPLLKQSLNRRQFRLRIVFEFRPIQYFQHDTTPY